MSENHVETPDLHLQDGDVDKLFGRQVEVPPAPPNSLGNIGVSTCATPVSQTLERRVDWLREDLEVVKRRVQDTLGPDASTPEGKAMKRGGVARLHSLANQLLGELAEEREWRENLEAELSSIETALLQERGHREKALETLSVELKETMKSLVRRIDTGLVNGTQELNSRAAKTEVSLKALIQRVEEGLVVGSKFLQETLGGSDLLEVCSNSSKATASSNSGLTSASALDASKEAKVETPLLKMWGELQEENLRLRQKRVQLEARQLRSRLNSRSPTSTSHAASPLGPSSRNRSPGGRNQHNLNLGTGFRFDRGAPKKDCQSPPATTDNSPVHSSVSRVEATSFLIGGLASDERPHTTPSGSVISDLLRDVDTMSTTSSLPNAKLSDDGRMDPRPQARQPAPSRFVGESRYQRRGSAGSHSPVPVGLQPNGGFLRAPPGSGCGPARTGLQSPGGTNKTGMLSPGGSNMPLGRSPQPVLQASRAPNVQGTSPPSISASSIGGVATNQRSSTGSSRFYERC